MASEARFAQLLVYLDEHRAELEALQCNDMRELLRTGEARQGRVAVPERAAWYRYLRQQEHLLSAAQVEQLRARENVLCQRADAERLVVQPARQQQLDKLLELLERRFDEFAALRKPSLKAVFDAHAAKSDKEMKFGKNFMSRCFPQLSQQQQDVLAEWEAMLCEPAADQRLAVQPALQRQLDKLLELLERRFDEFAALRKPSLKAVFDAHAAKSDKHMKFGQNFMSRCFPQLSQQQQDVLAEWEAMVCEPADDQFLAVQPALQRQLDKFLDLLERRFDEFAALRKPSLKAVFDAHAAKSDKEMKLGKNFMSRCFPQLSQQQQDVLAEWETMLCEPAADQRLAVQPALKRHVERYLEILRSRRSCFVQRGVSTPEQLFCASRRELDSDFRFGHRFLRWVRPLLSSDAQAQVSEAFQADVHGSDTCVVKRPHEPKLHEKETQLADDLPRPRLPKSLRQLYGHSAGAEARTRTFFHCVQEVDQFLLEQEFAACERCKEGWFGTRRTRDDMPGRFESGVFKKSNFLLAPETEWLEPGQAICRNCLAEAKARAKDGLPRYSFRFTAANYADPGVSLPETDALMFFEEKLLSPIQHIVRIFTLHATGPGLVSLPLFTRGCAGFREKAAVAAGDSRH